MKLLYQSFFFLSFCLDKQLAHPLFWHYFFKVDTVTPFCEDPLYEEPLTLPDLAFFL